MSFENWNRFVAETLKQAREAKEAKKQDGNAAGSGTAGVQGMNEKAKEARRAYKREWNRRNRDKVRAAQARYWERKAAAAGAARDQQIDEPAQQEA